jgi:5-methylcytosine-specific restriction protein A
MAGVLPLKPCTSPGCTNRVAGGRCPTHDRRARAQRIHWRDLYGDDWPDIRLDYLERHPRCVLCGRQASTPDHYPVGIRRLRGMGIANPHHDRYLRALCASCHSKHTGRHEPGGWHAQRQ